jgi:hypothetical protein
MSKGNWDESYLWKAMKTQVLNAIEQFAKQTATPTFIIHDNTISKKTKPSSQALHPIEATDFHYSHLECKTVWGHQLLCTLLSAGSLTLPYHIEYYEKDSTSKIDMVCQLVNSLPTVIGPAYGLCSLYSTNDVHLVTVNRQSYWVYRYEGALNDIDNAVVLFCWFKDSFLNLKALRTFLGTDITLATETILKYYSQRWPIETFFRQTKGNLGINQYQIHTITGIKRFWSLTALTYLFCTIGSLKSKSFAYGLRDMRKNFQTNLFVWIYKQAKANVPLSQVLHRLKRA